MDPQFESWLRSHKFTEYIHRFDEAGYHAAADIADLRCTTHAR
jgi:hypothetical protein